MYAIVDIETTGGHAAANGITEIAIYVHDGTKVIRHFHTLINPQCTIPRHITALTGISNEMVAAAPVFEDVAADIHAVLQGNIFVAHHVNFDFSFVKHYLKNAGFELGTRKLCTVRLSRKVFAGLPSYSLGSLCRSLKINIENRHRADGDAKATVKLFERILEQNGKMHIDEMLKKTSSEQWLPLHLEKCEIEQLPQAPGVYYFHNAQGKIIYVGKAINIKKRVSSHFTHNDAAKKRQHFLRLVHKISFTVCANELHALVLESAEIKKRWPKYNYSQKQPARKYGLYSFEDNRGYLRLAIDTRKKNIPALYYFNLLHEGTVMLKKMADEFGLDHERCFLKSHDNEKESNLTSESPARYNKKVKLALSALEKQLPTFAIIDEGLNKENKLCLLVERGSFWGMGYVDAREKISDLDLLKEKLEPYTDNDFIRNSIYSFAEANPGKKIPLNY